MKIRNLFLIPAIVLMTPALHAQVLEELSSPSMPAATAIGSQANEISRPKSWKALETALFSNFTDPENSSLIPRNYALELNPFMLSKRTNFDYLEYLDNKPGKNLWRNLSFSLASTDNYVINDTLTGSALGFGGRTMILNGKVNQQLESEYRSVSSMYNDLLAMQSQIRTMMGEYRNSLTRFSTEGLQLPDKPFEPDSLMVFLLKSDVLNQPVTAAVIGQVFSELSTTGKTYEEIRKEFITVFKAKYSGVVLEEYRRLLESVKTERYGLRWEVATAFSLNFPTNDFNNSISPNQGIWSNVSYRPFKKVKSIRSPDVSFKVPVNFEFIGLVRWINNNDAFINRYHPVDTLQFNAGEIFDFGLRGILEFGKLSVELEYIYRNNRNKEFITVDDNRYSRTVNDDTYKYLLNINYNISDNIVLSYNIGRNYDMVNSDKGNLISGLSVNFGFGSIRADDLAKAGMKMKEQ
jgi:hypothetical protein